MKNENSPEMESPGLEYSLSQGLRSEPVKYPSVKVSAQHQLK